MLEALTEEVIQHHDEVHDVTQAAAEELYISLCQQLDGYGQETFMARNEDGAEVMLGISVSGVIVGNSGSHKFYPWREIVNVVNHKRTFNIECTDNSQNVGFTLQDSETGRYIWKLCVNQHTFFMNYEQNHASQVNLSLFQNIPENFNDSREDLLSSDDKLYYSSSSHLAIPSSNTNLSVGTNPGKWITSSESLLNTNPMDSRTSLQTSAIDVNIPNPILGSSQWNPAGSNASLINRAQSSSCLDLANSNVNINNNVNKERLKSLLPTYRPAPSYETAIQQKNRGSQPDVGQLVYENFAHPQSQVQHFPDVTHHTSTTMIGPHYSDASDYGLPQRFKMMSVKPPPQYPANRLSSTSTPDLALASHRGVFGYRTSGSSPDLVSSRTLLQHGFIPSNAHSILYPYTSVAAGGGMKQRLRHSHSFLPHATYENLNFIETANPNLFHKHIPNNLIYRTASATAAQQMADMEYYLHKQQRNHSLNALNLSNSHISVAEQPIYENFPLPSRSEVKLSDNAPRKVSMEMRAQPVQPQPRSIQTEPSMDTTNMMNKYNNSSRNVNEASNGNENFKYSKQQHYLIVTGDMNNGNSMSGSASKINVSQEKDVNLNNIPASASASSLYQNQQTMKQRQQSNMMNTSSTSSNYTINTTTTADTTDSGISTSMGGKKEKGEKRNKIWNILSGGSKNKTSSSKQKSATLGREKEKSKKDKHSRDAAATEAESNLRHRWSTGLPRLQPLPANISKEKLCQLLETKLNDSQLFLEFERIPKRKENAQYSCAIHDENRNKNSDRTLLPMDDNRVKLIPTRENRMGYVNASHITVR
jgi:tyrosine-protein phosphatase non-receptor type 14/21